MYLGVLTYDCLAEKEAQSSGDVHIVVRLCSYRMLLISRLRKILCAFTYYIYIYIYSQLWLDITVYCLLVGGTIKIDEVASVERMLYKGFIRLWQCKSFYI